MIVEFKRPVVKEQAINENGATVQLVKSGGKFFTIQARISKEDDFTVLDNVSEQSAFLCFDMATAFLEQYCKRYNM